MYPRGVYLRKGGWLVCAGLSVYQATNQATNGSAEPSFSDPAPRTWKYKGSITAQADAGEDKGNCVLHYDTGTGTLLAGSVTTCACDGNLRCRGSVCERGGGGGRQQTVWRQFVRVSQQSALAYRYRHHTGCKQAAGLDGSTSNSRAGKETINLAPTVTRICASYSIKVGPFHCACSSCVGNSYASSTGTSACTRRTCLHTRNILLWPPTATCHSVTMACTRCRWPHHWMEGGAGRTSPQSSTEPQEVPSELSPN